MSVHMRQRGPNFSAHQRFINFLLHILLNSLNKNVHYERVEKGVQFAVIIAG